MARQQAFLYVHLGLASGRIFFLYCNFESNLELVIGCEGKAKKNESSDQRHILNHHEPVASVMDSNTSILNVLNRAS